MATITVNTATKTVDNDKLAVVLTALKTKWTPQPGQSDSEFALACIIDWLRSVRDRYVDAQAAADAAAAAAAAKPEL